VRILHDPAGSGSAPPGVQVLQGGECSSNSAFSRLLKRGIYGFYWRGRCRKPQEEALPSWDPRDSVNDGYSWFNMEDDDL